MQLINILNKNMKKSIVIVLVVVVLLVLYGVTMFNSLVSKNEEVDNQWAKVETQYQRRFDLIPNLVETVKGAMKQEQDVFGKIADARTKYAGSKTVDEKAVAASEVEGALARLLVVMENYPQLKSMDVVLSLKDELAGTENRVSVERTRFNDTVKEINVSVKKFPTNLFAFLFGFGERSYFQAVVGSEEAPKVNF